MFRSLVDREKDYLDAYLERYRSTRSRRRRIRPKTILKKAIENNPTRFELRLKPGRSYTSRKRRDEVVRARQTQISRQGISAAFEPQVGAFYCRLGDGARRGPMRANMRKPSSGIGAEGLLPEDESSKC